jgi:hypothetical protein
MSLALEFKQRVRMAPDPPERRVRERRSPVLVLGVCSWLGAVTFGVGVDQGYLPIGRWVDGLESDPDDRAPAPRPESLEPLRPVAAQRAPSPPAVAAPIAPAPRSDLPVSSSDREPSSVARSTAVPPPVAVANAEPDDEPAGDDPSRSPSAVQTPEFDQPLPTATWAGATRAQGCEAAARAYTEELDLRGGRPPPDITQPQYAAILEQGRWFAHCRVPATCQLEVCVAVREGRAVGVTVHATPWRADIERCVAAAARGLTFPNHPRLDVTRTTFAPR